MPQKESAKDVLELCDSVDIDKLIKQRMAWGLCHFEPIKNEGLGVLWILIGR
jgi:hypothetical protein